MDGMILAAGVGRRLRPLTDRTPKALIRVGGVPMLERVAARLIGAGVDRLVVNVHHHAGQVRRYLEEREGFGVEVRVSEEAELPLETGGGLLQARSHFRGDAPFFLHNVDVISDADLSALYRAHLESGALATLAVSDRTSSRRLRFDSRGLCGRVDARTGAHETVRASSGAVREQAFAGIHVISPRFFDLLEEQGTFSIMDAYLRLARQGHEIRRFDITGALWLEIGDPDRLERARRHLRRGDGQQRD